MGKKDFKKNSGFSLTNLLYWFDLKFPAQPIGKTREFSNKTSIIVLF